MGIIQYTQFISSNKELIFFKYQNSKKTSNDIDIHVIKLMKKTIPGCGAHSYSAMDMTATINTDPNIFIVSRLNC